jgi:hypothetical protein
MSGRLGSGLASTSLEEEEDTRDPDFVDAEYLRELEAGMTEDEKEAAGERSRQLKAEGNQVRRTRVPVVA